MTITLRSDIVSEFVDGYGGDWLFLDAARASSAHGAGAGPRPITTPKGRGTINSLIKRRHGSPFKHGGMTFYIEAPIFVFREIRTHFVNNYQLERGDGTWEIVQTLEGLEDGNYSEASGRYRPFEGEYWVPDRSRPMIVPPSGFNPMAPVLWSATPEQYDTLISHLRGTYTTEWNNYQAILEMGFAPEVARASAGIAIYSAMYMSINPLAALRLLCLRVDSPNATYETHPQLETQRVVEPIERYVAETYPATYEAFVRNGRVSP